MVCHHNGLIKLYSKVAPLWDTAYELDFASQGEFIYFNKFYLDLSFKFNVRNVKKIANDASYYSASDESFSKR